MLKEKVLNIGSKRTLLLLLLLLLVTFAVFLVTMLHESEPPKQAKRVAKTESPQMVKGKIQLPQPIEISKPAIPPPKSAAQEVKPPGLEVPGAGETPLQPVDKTLVTVTKPVAPKEKPAPVAETPKSLQAAAVERREGPSPVPMTGRKYTVQVGAFARQATAEKLASRLRESGFEVNVKSGPAKGGQTLYMVQVGSFANILEAKKMEARLHARKDITSTFVKEIR
jgi:cell division septation protein DedD